MLFCTSLYSQEEKEIRVILKDGTELNGDLIYEGVKSLKLFIEKPSFKKRKKYDKTLIPEESVERVIIKATNSSLLMIYNGHTPKGYTWSKKDGFIKRKEDKYKDINTLDGVKIFEYIDTKSKKYILAELVEEGKCNLYTTYESNVKGTRLIYIRYLKRKNEKFATKINRAVVIGSNIKKVGVEYFNDCPKLVQLIKEKKMKTSLDLVKYYNNSCL